MTAQDRRAFVHGMRNGIPIMLGYLAVGFTLGIAAKQCGLTAAEAGLASFLNMASAGEFAGFSMMATSSSLIALALTEIVINARYLLMSASLSQKIRPETGLVKRLLLSCCVTDEIFGISIAEPGYLNPFYSLGALLVAIPGWTLGTYFGALLGSVLPLRAMSALSVALYGMFIAVFVPPARKDRVIAATVAASFAASWFFSAVPAFSGISSGTKIIILTVVIAGIAAAVRPVDENGKAQKRSGAGVQEEA